MDAKTLLDSGNLGGAVEAALAAVKANPTDVSARIFLFELSLFSGDWDRAARQLDVIGHQNVEAMIGAKIYEQNVHLERERAKFFESGGTPEHMMAQPDYVQKLIEANQTLCRGDKAAALALLDEVEAERPAFAVSVNGKSYTDFRDANDLTSCVFEVLVKDTYTWLAFEHVVRVEFYPPKSLRDLYWTQAKVGLANGSAGEMFFPALYVNTHKSQDDNIRLGKITDWIEAAPDIFAGEGMRVFRAGEDFIPLSKFEVLEFSQD